MRAASLVAHQHYPCYTSAGFKRKPMKRYPRAIREAAHCWVRNLRHRWGEEPVPVIFMKSCSELLCPSSSVRPCVTKLSWVTEWLYGTSTLNWQKEEEELVGIKAETHKSNSCSCSWKLPKGGFTIIRHSYQTVHTYDLGIDWKGSVEFMCSLWTHLLAQTAIKM